MSRDEPLALYMEGAFGDFTGKLGYGVLRYSPNPISCVIDSRLAGKRVPEIMPEYRDAPIVATVEEARSLGAKVFVLGIAPPGGLVPPEWWGVIDRAVELGLNVVNGLHDLVAPRYSKLALGQWIWDIRIEPPGLAPARGRARELKARRLLMVGTDMGIGKMTAGLEIVRAAREMGMRAEFVATGQIGILLTGSGVPLDAVRVDFAGGAIEREMLRYPEAELIVVEGQGSLVHPGSTSPLPLSRGSMPTHLILCHKAGMTHLQRVPEVEVPNLRRLFELHMDLAEACGSFPRPVAAGVALNTSHLSEGDAKDHLKQASDEAGVVCTDPVRFGASILVESVMA